MLYTLALAFMNSKFKGALRHHSTGNNIMRWPNKGHIMYKVLGKREMRITFGK